MKESKAAISSAENNEAKTVKKLIPRGKQAPDQQAEAFVKMAGSVENAVNQLAAMMQRQQEQSDARDEKLQAENKILKDGFLVMQHEMKALRERAVRLKPVTNPDGSYKHIDVIPMQKTTKKPH